MPVIDAVYFCDPKYSKIDIVQAASRALRKAEGKKLGYIVVPIFHNKNEAAEEITSKGPFKSLINVVRALSSHDERLVDEITKIKLGKGPKAAGSLDHISIQVDALELIALEGFEDTLKERIFTEVMDTLRCHLGHLKKRGSLYVP